MIKRITDFDSLSGVSSPLFPLIFSDCMFTEEEYGGAFAQYNENGGITAIFSSLNGCVNFFATEKTDYSEISDFFAFLRIKEITSDTLLPIMKNASEYDFLTYQGDFSIIDKCEKLSPYSSLGDYKNIYGLLCENGGNFDDWFLRLSKKINNNSALAVFCEENGEVVSALTVPAVLKNNAVIAGVATKTEYRRKGYASKCVNSAVSQLFSCGVDEIGLWCGKGNIPFYEKNGFIKKSKIYVGECENELF